MRKSPKRRSGQRSPLPRWAAQRARCSSSESRLLRYTLNAHAPEEHEQHVEDAHSEGGKKQKPGTDGADTKPKHEEMPTRKPEAPKHVQEQPKRTVEGEQGIVGHHVSNLLHATRKPAVGLAEGLLRVGFPMIGLTELGVRHSIGRIPGIGKLYSGPRDWALEKVRRIGEVPFDVAEPVARTFEDIGQGALNRTVPSEHTKTGFRHAVEVARENLGKLITLPFRKGFNLMKFLYTNGVVPFVGGTMTFCGSVIKVAFSGPGLYVTVPLGIVAAGLIAIGGWSAPLQVIGGIAKMIAQWAGVPIP